MKRNGEIKNTWDELAIILSRETGMMGGENKWRKHYDRIKRVFRPETNTVDVATEMSPEIYSRYLDMEKKRIQLRDERLAYKKNISCSARHDAILDLFKNEIRKAVPPNKPDTPVCLMNRSKAMIAMLSDIHYGMTFDNASGSYDRCVAEQRVLAYAERIIDIADENNINVCYVPLMGDLISGNIHSTIRIENRENLVQQVIGVSELIAEFLDCLAVNFDEVYVVNVPGNHSRMTEKDDAMNGERLDNLPIWYCKAKLDDYPNVLFITDNTDDTMAEFDVCGKKYVAVHGDYDGDAVKATHRIRDVIGSKFECLLTAHMHVFEAKFDECKMVRNGSVVGSGDEFTQRLRLKSDPYQVVVICNEDGIESIHPVKLNK